MLEFVGRPVSRAAAASADGTAGHTFTLRPPTARVPSSTMYGGGAGGEGKAGGGSRAAGSASNGMPLAAARVLVTWKPWEDEEKGRYQPVKVRVRAVAEEEGGEGRGEERTRGGKDAGKRGSDCCKGWTRVRQGVDESNRQRGMVGGGSVRGNDEREVAWIGEGGQGP